MKSTLNFIFQEQKILKLIAKFVVHKFHSTEYLLGETTKKIIFFVTKLNVFTYISHFSLAYLVYILQSPFKFSIINKKITYFCKRFWTLPSRHFREYIRPTTIVSPLIEKCHPWLTRLKLTPLPWLTRIGVVQQLLLRLTRLTMTKTERLELAVHAHDPVGDYAKLPSKFLKRSTRPKTLVSESPQRASESPRIIYKHRYLIILKICDH